VKKRRFESGEEREDILFREAIKSGQRRILRVIDLTAASEGIASIESL